jgi:predicted helicase
MNSLDDAVKIVGCWNGLGKHVAAEDGMDISADPQAMRTAIAFAQSIKHSKLLTAEFERISNDLADEIDYLPALEAKHVDGTMNVVERNQKLSWLKGNIGKDEPVCRILTNARCLSEGVDVPALDAAIFLNPRDSVVDVVQSVGRVMRKDPAGRKKYGYVILPIGIRKDTSPRLRSTTTRSTAWCGKCSTPCALTMTALTSSSPPSTSPEGQRDRQRHRRRCRK